MNAEDISRAKQTRAYWRARAETIPVDVLDQIGLAYITLVLGLDEQTALRFLTDSEAYHQVGLKQSGVPRGTNTSAFWKKVAELLPDLHSKENLDWIISPGGVNAVFNFLDILRHDALAYSELLDRLSANAHVYK